MIVTVTANPAADVIYELGGTVCADGLNRAKASSVNAGGKGINVSRAVLRACGGACDGALATLALLGGHTGDMFAAKLEEEGLPVTKIPTLCETRINICAVSPDGEACEINAPGGPVRGEELDALTETLSGTVGEGDIVILAGSLPKCTGRDPVTYWSELIPVLRKKGCTVILDCSGEALRLAVNGECPPDMIKPNLDELCELLGTDTDALMKSFGSELTPGESPAENLFRCAEAASETLAAKGISVLATLGSHGAVYTCAEDPARHIRQKSCPVARVANVKGAGDTFLGVFTAGRYLLGRDVKDALAAASEGAAAHVGGGTQLS